MSRNKRELTKQELLRKERFEELQAEMKQNGYREKSLTAGVWKGNIAAFIVMLPFMIGNGWLYVTVNSLTKLLLPNWVLFFIVFLCLVVVHELIHGIVWGFFAPDHFRSIEFGIIWKALTPYCACSQPLKKWQYLLGGMMPTLVLGTGTVAAAIIFQSDFWFYMSEFMLFSGGADIYIALKILMCRTKSRDVVYFDHPYELGVVLFEK